MTSPTTPVRCPQRNLLIATFVITALVVFVLFQFKNHMPPPDIYDATGTFIVTYLLSFSGCVGLGYWRRWRDAHTQAGQGAADK
jgi:hypothetical protein